MTAGAMCQPALTSPDKVPMYTVHPYGINCTPTTLGTKAYTSMRSNKGSTHNTSTTSVASVALDMKGKFIAVRQVELKGCIDGVMLLEAEEHLKVLHIYQYCSVRGSIEYYRGNFEAAGSYPDTLSL